MHLDMLFNKFCRYLLRDLKLWIILLLSLTVVTGYIYSLDVFSIGEFLKPYNIQTGNKILKADGSKHIMDIIPFDVYYKLNLNKVNHNDEKVSYDLDMDKVNKSISSTKSLAFISYNRFKLIDKIALQLNLKLKRDGHFIIKTTLTETQLRKSTIWSLIGCRRPSCMFDNITTSVLPIVSHQRTNENNYSALPCSMPKGTLIAAITSPIYILNLTATINCDLGGRWQPSGCKPKQKVALLVPYRDRATMLGTWLRHIHWFLQQQKLGYAIYIVEQDQHSPFNRAASLNIAAKYAMEGDDYDCFINHDIDQLPVNLQNSYTCDEDPNKVTHYARNVSCRKSEPYKNHFGLVTSLTPTQFLSVNGYSNLYFGWGAEDDDMSLRLQNRGYKITNRPYEVGRYRCLSHVQANPSADRQKYLISASRRRSYEGFNSLKFELLAYSETPLFTWIYVHIDRRKIRSRFIKAKSADFSMT